MRKRDYLRILIIACGLAASAVGLCTNSVGVFYTPVSQDLGVLRGTFAFHATLSLITTAVVSLLIPWLSSHLPYKPLLIAGIFLSAGSTALMGTATHVAMFYALGVLRGAGVGLYGTVPITMLVNNWFHKKNGTAVGIALSFSGLSGAVCSSFHSFGKKEHHSAEKGPYRSGPCNLKIRPAAELPPPIVLVFAALQNRVRHSHRVVS